MSAPLLKTKLYVPPVRSEVVSRSRLIERLTEGLRRGRRLILISAPAGYGKTTLLSDWVAQSSLSGLPVAGLRSTRATTTRPGSGPTLSPQFGPCMRTSSLLLPLPFGLRIYGPFVLR